MTWMFRVATMLLLSAVSFESMVSGQEASEESSSKKSRKKKVKAKTSKENAPVQGKEALTGKEAVKDKSSDQQELSDQQMEKINQLLSPALETAPLKPGERHMIMQAAADAAKAVLSLGLKVSQDLSCPVLRETLALPLVQQSVSTINIDLSAKEKKTQDASGDKFFANLRERYNGILTPLNEKAAEDIKRYRYGKILGEKGDKAASTGRGGFDTPERKGNVYLYPTFSVEGLPIGRLLTKLKFKSKGNKDVAWDQVAVHRNKMMAGVSCSKRTAERYPCSNWGHFQNHLKNCTFQSKGMKSCFVEAASSENTTLTRMLEQYWDSIRSNELDVKASSTDLQPGVFIGWSIKRFASKDQFINDPSVRNNAAFVFVLRELEKRQVNHSAARALTGPARKEIITGMLTDVAQYLAKLQLVLTESQSKGMMSGATSALKKGASGGVSSEAGRLLNKLVEKYEKELKAQEAAENKAAKDEKKQSNKSEKPGKKTSSAAAKQ